MNGITALFRRHPLATYFALAFVVSWGGVLLVIGGPAGIPGTKEETDRLFPLAFLAMLAGPSLAGLLAVLLTQGKAGLRGLWSRLIRWRVGVRWYAIALLTAPLLTATVLLSLSLLSRDFMPGVLTATDKMSTLLFGLIVGLGAGVFEELGWTGFVIPRLRRRHGVLAAGLFLGMIWGAWHVLVNLWASGTPTRGLSAVFMLPVLLSTVGLGVLPAYRVLMVWVYERTGSLLVGMLMHVSLTASLIILRPAATGMGLVIYEFAWAGTLWALMATIAVTARRRLSHSDQQRIGRAQDGTGDAVEENMTKRGSGARALGIVAMIVGPLILTPARALAHCDRLDGPVVTAARHALEKNDVTGVLIWVQKKDEAEIRQAFERTVAVRQLGSRARDLADMYFFETLVRVHRAGEGASYTGLKPAAQDLEPAISGADRALETGDIEPLVKLLVQATGEGVREHFMEARAARNFRAGDVEAGRAYIQTYVSFIHYVERLHQSATTAAHGHFGAQDQPEP